ncbi:YcfA-like protein [Acetobacter pasteurianus subsp. pasteurianus LMG 1262 = NBRC 106471]|nr:YcfA-like protein [Acetobacter pasteurianus subsp. pasteurianus LMG 1262 = NBRC 106471]
MRLRRVLSATPCFFAIWRFDKAPARKSVSIACQSVSVFLGIPHHPAQQKCALQNAGTKNFSRVPLARFRCHASGALLPLPLPAERIAGGCPKIHTDTHFLHCSWCIFVCMIMRMDSREIIKKIKADGWYLVATKGSHQQFKHPTKPGRVTVPHPKRDLPLGTLRSVEKQSGVKLK